MLAPMRAVALCLSLFSAPLASACDTALLLAVDVSNSIDSNEYTLQSGGIADALYDPVIRDALISGQSALAVVQWSGPKDQVVSIPWRRIRSEADANAFAEEARAMKRAVFYSNTAIGSVMTYSFELFPEMRDCARHVIDISGDGQDNAQTSPQVQRHEAERRGIDINGLAIEPVGLAITNFYRQRVITANGFVMTARGYADYPRALRAKMRRELTKAVALAD